MKLMKIVHQIFIKKVIFVLIRKKQRTHLFKKETSLNTYQFCFKIIYFLLILYNDCFNFETNFTIPIKC